MDKYGLEEWQRVEWKNLKENLECRIGFKYRFKGASHDQEMHLPVASSYLADRKSKPTMYL